MRLTMTNMKAKKVARKERANLPNPTESIKSPKSKIPPLRSLG